MYEKRINIFIGAFGSGKSEIAVNYTLELNKTFSNLAIVDLDIVNPFFRSADAHEVMNSHGIRLIKPIYANTSMDVPALPPEINSVLEDKRYTVVLDVGGDDLGAKAVSTYKSFIEKDSYNMFFVVNTLRPFTNTPERIEEMLDSVEAATRLKITHVVNNTNLLNYTNPDDVMAGNDIIKKVAAKKEISFGFISAMPKTAQELKKCTNDKILELDEFIKLPWSRNEE